MDRRSFNRMQGALAAAPALAPLFRAEPARAAVAIERGDDTFR